MKEISIANEFVLILVGVINIYLAEDSILDTVGLFVGCVELGVVLVFKSLSPFGSCSYEVWRFCHDWGKLLLGL
jgi:hypothetical protein